MKEGSLTWLEMFEANKKGPNWSLTSASIPQHDTHYLKHPRQTFALRANPVIMVLADFVTVSCERLAWCSGFILSLTEAPASFFQWSCQCHLILVNQTTAANQAVPLASSFSLCTETSRDSLSSSSLSKKAFLSMAWFSLCSKSSKETIVALENKNPEDAAL